MAEGFQSWDKVTVLVHSEHKISGPRRGRRCMKHFILAQHAANWLEGLGRDIHKCHPGFWPGVDLGPMKQVQKYTLRRTNTPHITWTSSHQGYCNIAPNSVASRQASQVRWLVPDGTAEPPGDMETRFNCAATQALTHIDPTHWRGHGISSICRRKATMMPPFFSVTAPRPSAVLSAPRPRV